MKEKRNIVIVGANSYLGSEFCKKIADKSKYQVFATSRSVNEALENIQSTNFKYLPHIDLTLESNLKTLRNKINLFFNDRFSVINCAGHFPGYKSLEKISLTGAKKTLTDNVLALYGVAKFIIPIMIEKKGGHFISFSSHTLYQNYPLTSIFNASKAGVESLNNSIANEFSKDKITATTFALATLLTDSEIEIKPKGDHDNWLKLSEVSELVLRYIELDNELINGNTIHLFKHSDSYFHQSYFDRIKR